MEPNTSRRSEGLPDVFQGRSAVLDDIFSLGQAASLLGCTSANLRAAIRRGRFDARRVGRDWVTTGEAIAVYRVFVMERRRIRY